MSEKPNLTHMQIESRASQQSFSRGKTLYNKGSVSNTIRRGDEIEARCSGSYPEPYRVWATFHDSDIAATGCNCEYDWGGDCKHIVAMLLTYLYEPEAFEVRQTRHDDLMAREKAELVDIIEQMITRYPDLDEIIKRRTLVDDDNMSDVQIDEQSFRHELRQSLSFSGQWMDQTAENKVYELASVGERFAKRGDAANALAIYCTILEECNDHPYPTDDEGDYVVAVNYTVDRLNEALSELDLANEEALRQRMLDALVGTVIWDVEFGGIGYGDDAEDIILKLVHPTDVQRIRERIQRSMRHQAEKERFSNWYIEAYERFLLKLDAFDETDPEETLKRLQSQGLHYLYASKLLELKRDDEAVAVIREHLTAPHELQRGLNLLVTHEQTTRAIELAGQSLETAYEKRIMDWLIYRYQVEGNQEAEFRWQLKQMQSDPSIDHYAALKTVSESNDNWQHVRLQIIDQLNEKNTLDVLTLVYLHDEAWDLAWETLGKVSLPQPHHFSWAIYRLDFTVAEKSRHVRPARAIPVYVKYARAEIALRNRKHYARAADLLKVVKALYDQTENSDDWKCLISDLKTEFKRLPALQDELKKAGL